MIPWLVKNTPFPPLEQALGDPNGLLCAGGDLSPERLLAAYRRGIFPWYSEDQPILWWSPDPRMVLSPAEIRLPRSLKKTLRNKAHSLRVDTAFEDVMRACAAPRAGETGSWISEAMIRAYTDLYKAGYAHSVEIWMEDRLVGGLYGVALGKMFFGESMFSRERDTSKMALIYLARQLERWQFGLIDCQMHTDHLARMGAREMPRAVFAPTVAELVDYPGLIGKWRFDNDLLE